ncbi:ATP-binding cassette domain-containing protein [Corynebacterium bovis]|uniref:ABC transporter ATP-binding protein n=1 Tax=Corynebacterium bovis TaxID=36808 RepID=UPI002447D913|nr:ATP-binding cassette domain-containing protein [Corynebacterium bovis]MDH2454915.1 ATP-binding cassette domain-containing protein [Corynebacterium bovis]
MTSHAPTPPPATRPGHRTPRRSPTPRHATVRPVVARGVTRRFGRRTVIPPTDVTVHPGEIFGLTGPSGAGKTTMLALLSGLDSPSSGTVTAPSRRERAFVFQDYNLLESLTARDNALLTARLLGRRTTRRDVRDVFASLGLDGLERRLPHQLSGGQQQRVAVARVLLARVPYIFADEPTGALDPASAAVVLDHLRGCADRGAAVVLVTHTREAMRIVDRVLPLGGGGGGGGVGPGPGAGPGVGAGPGAAAEIPR